MKELQTLRSWTTKKIDWVEIVGLEKIDTLLYDNYMIQCRFWVLLDHLVKDERILEEL
jgi:hypothetical protein